MHLYNFYYLEGVFPIILNGIILDFCPMDNDTLKKYLEKMEIFDVGHYTFKELQSFENEECVFSDLMFGIYELQQVKREVMYGKDDLQYLKDRIIRIFIRTIKRNIVMVEEPQFKKLSSEEIDYIIQNIQELNEQYFYSLSITAQIKIINNLICQKYNKDYYLQKNMYEMLETDYFDNDDLLNNSSDYIKYKSKIELIIIALLNNLLLFCYNQNKSNIDVRNLKFSLNFYKDYLDCTIDKFYEISKEEIDYRLIYTSLLKTSSTHTLNEEDYREVEKKLLKTKNQINAVSNIIDGHGTDEEFAIINADLLNRMRDCLAHGFLTVNVENINDIMSSKLRFYDKYDGMVQFDSIISLGELLKTINQSEFINSILNDNQNFIKHSN